MAVRILIVDDEPLIRLMLVDALEGLGASVEQAADANDAWSILHSGLPFDLVFTDHVMPGGKTGAQLIADIKADFPRVRTALGSGYMRGDRATATSVFEKPYDVLQTAKTLLMLATKSPFESE